MKLNVQNRSYEPLKENSVFNSLGLIFIVLYFVQQDCKPMVQMIAQDVTELCKNPVQRELKKKKRNMSHFLTTTAYRLQALTPSWFSFKKSRPLIQLQTLTSPSVNACMCDCMCVLAVTHSRLTFCCFVRRHVSKLLRSHGWHHLWIGSSCYIHTHTHTFPLWWKAVSTVYTERTLRNLHQFPSGLNFTPWYERYFLSAVQLRALLDRKLKTGEKR